jgi:nitrate/nitrite-specific signal transduction histidine kinase
MYNMRLRLQEAMVQEALADLLQGLKQETGAKFFVHDASVKAPLKNPQAKIDFIFTFDDIVRTGYT